MSTTAERERYLHEAAALRPEVHAAAVEALMALPSVAAVWEIGSASRGATDVHSDIDLLAMVPEGEHEAAAGEWPARLAGLGRVLQVKELRFRGSTTVNAVLAPWVRLDVSFVPGAGLRERVVGTAVHVAGSTDDAPAAEWSGPRRTLSPEQAADVVAEFYRVLALATVPLGREDPLLVIMGLGLLRDLTIRVLKAAQTMPDAGGMMHLRDQLPPAAYDVLLRASAPMPTHDAILAAHATIEELFWSTAQPLVTDSPQHDDLVAMRSAALDHLRRGA